MLTFLLIIPLLGSFILIFINDVTLINQVRIKKVAFFISIIIFIQSLIIWAEFDSTINGYQFNQSYTTLGFCHFHVGIDALSLYYIILTAFLFPICFLASWNNVKANLKAYFILLFMTETFLISVFSVLDLLLFYVFFEAALIPLFLIVGIWGGSNTRIRAALLLFLYTLTGSLFILLAIITIADIVGSTDFVLITEIDFSFNLQYFLWIGFFIAFAIKTPIVPFHIWLPRAHAEAPLAGSILLAGIVLKLSSYGILRILLPIFPEASNYFTPFVQIIAIITLIYSSLATIRQVDFKALVAYSSIAHIAIVILGLFSNTLIGIEGGYILSLAHGFVSPALFVLVGGVLYDRFHTRTILYYRGIIIYIPIFSILFFITACANIAVPLSLNWISEFIALAGTFQRSFVVGILGASGIILSACYTIWLWSRIIGGNWSFYLNSTVDVTQREFIILVNLLFFPICLGICPNIILKDIHYIITSILYTIIPFKIE